MRKIRNFVASLPTAVLLTVLAVTAVAFTLAGCEGQAPVSLNGQYPLTDCYVNLKLVFGQSRTLAPVGARDFYVNWLSLDLPPSRASGSNDRDGELTVGGVNPGHRYSW